MAKLTLRGDIMSELTEQIDALEDALTRLRQGEFQVFDQFPVILDGLRRTCASVNRRQDELQSLYEVGRELTLILDLGKLLRSILDRAIALVGAERGFLVLAASLEEELEVAVARKFGRGEVDETQLEISRSIIRRVLASRAPVITTNAQEDPRFRTQPSVITYQIRSVLAAPMIAKEDLIGAVYVDTRLSSGLFGTSELELLSAMTNQAAVAIHLTQLYEDLQAKNLALRRTLAELRATQDELIRAERLSLVGRVAASIIHDIKNPMTSIKGYAHLLGQPDLPAERRKQFSRVISQTVDRFVDMTQDILDYSRGGGKIHPEMTDLEVLIDEVCTLIEPEFADRDMEIRRSLRYTGPIWIDPSRIRRALLNIAMNARDEMGAGGVLTITADADDDLVELRISDTGPGIPKEIQGSLFEPFVTLGKPTGTGLGLAIAKKSIEDHQGSIAAESVAGKGATFIIRLPLRQMGADPAHARAA
jgi:signal transduction histidine kinase